MHDYFKSKHEINIVLSSNQISKLLNLLFTDILKIDNLWEFTKLTKLQLDNNIIEKIEGLESLVNLVWLGKRVSVI